MAGAAQQHPLEVGHRASVLFMFCCELGCAGLTAYGMPHASRCCRLACRPHQVRSLREELLGARRERALTEAHEAELRREIAGLKRQVSASLSRPTIIPSSCLAW